MKILCTPKWTPLSSWVVIHQSLNTEAPQQQSYACIHGLDTAVNVLLWPGHSYRISGFSGAGLYLNCR